VAKEDETVAKQDLATIRAGYRELRRIFKHGLSYPWKRYIAPSGILTRYTFHTDEAADVTVCVLTSRNDWLMCLWSLASFYRFSDLRLPLLIYSDGTLTSRHLQRIRSVFPHARVVDPVKAEAAGRETLSEFPNCPSSVWTSRAREELSTYRSSASQNRFLCLIQTFYFSGVLRSL
jgi:hypothetical protein